MSRKLRGAESPSAEPGEGLSRRGLFGALPMVAAAGVGVAVLGDALTATPASAHVGDSLILGEDNDADGAMTSLSSTSETVLEIVAPAGLTTDLGGAYLVLQDPLNGGGVIRFISDQPSSAGGTTSALLTVNDGPGLLTVDGRTTGGPSGLGGDTAIAATARGSAVITAQGTSGSSNESGTPVELPSVALEATVDQHGTAIIAASREGAALVAANTDATTSHDAVLVDTAGFGRALLATTANAKNKLATVTGIHNGFGAGIWGTQNNPTATSAAVIGQAEAKGRGGQFAGGAAAVRMMPGTAATHPPTGLLGDFYVDSTSRLWFCKGGSAWHQLA